MGKPRETIWPLDDHTEGKHRVLAGYLKAWLPILGTKNRRIVFIDGFAGPGVYKGGEDGSPAIALKALAEHAAAGKIKAEVVFVFIEQNPKRAKTLGEVVDDLQGDLPGNCHVHVVEGIFDREVTDLLDDLEEGGGRLAPCFAMLDPFGVKDTPMSLVARLLKQDRCEVFVTLMWPYINRFRTSEEFPPHLDGLFGTDEWRECVGIADTEERRECFYAVYEQQLRVAGAEHVVHFDLLRGNELVYSIFFATKHHLGSDRMKGAIWKVAPFGDFAFRGNRSGQIGLGIDETDYGPLRAALTAEFGGRDYVTIEQVLEFVASDKTDYYTAQVRGGALIPMEAAGAIEVDSDRKKSNTYPPKRTRLRFRSDLG